MTWTPQGAHALRWAPWTIARARVPAENAKGWRWRFVLTHDERVRAWCGLVMNKAWYFDSEAAAQAAAHGDTVQDETGADDGTDR